MMEECRSVLAQLSNDLMYVGFNNFAFDVYQQNKREDKIDCSV